ncbi:MAG: hypothetical protein J6X55_03320 [Victivallales bacterium]|nr:hypothetical protein [Victivallales bacterium]
MQETIRIPHIEGNATPAIVEACGKIHPNTLISFEKGIYHFTKDGAHEKDIRGIHIMPGLKQVVFDLDHVENLTIDGNGSEFMFDDILFPFAMIHCRNITLRNFTIDFSFSRYCQGEVVQSDESGFELAIDSSHFSAEVDAGGHVIFHSRDLSVSTEDRAILIGNAIFGRSPWDYVFAGDTQQSKENLPTSYIETDAVATPRGMRFNYREQSRRLVFPLGDNLIFCYEPRKNVNILSYMGENIHLENVAMYRGGGMGVVIARTRDFYADNVSIQVRPGRNECRSTTADGFFLVQNDGAVSLRNCLISHTLDDALNIHGSYHKVSEVSGNVIIFDVGYNAHRGFMSYEPQDRLTVSDRETHCFKASFTVLKADMLPDERIRLELDGDCSAISVDDIVENDSRVPKFIFENNKVVCCPHLRISDNGPIVIRHNTFDRINCILVIDLLKYWYEAGAVNGMVIEDNLFTGTPQAGKGYAINIYSSRKKGTDIRHKDISIVNNRFISPNTHAIAAAQVDGLVIRGNDFHGGVEDTMLLIDDCTGVCNCDNQFNA